MASLSQDLTRKFKGDRKADIESGRWIAVQKRIFTRWANAYLKARKLRIEVPSYSVHTHTRRTWH